MKKKLAMLLALSMTVCGALTGCGGSEEASAGDNKDMVYAVETGSAGEAAAQEQGFTINGGAS